VLAAAYVVSEIVGGFTQLTCSTGHAGVSANSQLTLRVDHSMKPVSVAESTAIGAACHGAALHSYAPVVEEAWFDARPRQPSGKNPNHGSDRNGGYGAKLVR
jgi:hypothetical protein